MLDQPIILLAFNDDFDGDRLRDISKEQQEIYTALKPAEDAGLCKIIQLAAAGANDILHYFREYRDRIRIFHFAGHANSFQLKTREAEMHGESFAAFLGHQNGLDLVFLNACATFMQAEALVQHGVKAVIATYERIYDEDARAFAKQYYQSFATGLDIFQAFDEAQQALLAQHNGKTRSMYWEQNPERDPALPPWSISPIQPNSKSWSLYNLREVRHSLKTIKQTLQDYKTLKNQFPDAPLSLPDHEYAGMNDWLKSQLNQLNDQPDRIAIMQVKQAILTKTSELTAIKRNLNTLTGELLNHEAEKLNYQNEKIFFDKYLLEYEEPVGIFVIHGLWNYGHKWLMDRLLLKRNNIDSKVVVVEGKVGRTREKNWLHIFLISLARQLFKQHSDDLSTFEKIKSNSSLHEKLELITNRICQRLENDETIIFRLNNFIYGIPVEDADVFLQELVNNFWQTAYPKFKHSAEMGFGKLMIFMLEKTDEPIVDELSSYLELTPEASKNHKAPLILDIQKIQYTDLHGWYTAHMTHLPITKIRKKLIELSDIDHCKALTEQEHQTHIGIFQHIYECCETTFEEIDDF